ncbi:hypothetical protein BJX61DRAFT_458045 [Aspergillus egyptiacus]|nr:hypothetical protein BJX61DRAFT_458045 [Aspergillus egyptiacus]
MSADERCFPSFSSGIGFVILVATLVFIIRFSTTLHQISRRALVICRFLETPPSMLLSFLLWAPLDPGPRLVLPWVPQSWMETDCR